MNYDNLQFKVTNISELRDETLYMKLKINIQKEVYLVIYLKSILFFYKLCVQSIKKKDIFLEILNDEFNNALLNIEVTEFMDFIKEMPEILESSELSDTNIKKILHNNCDNYIELFKSYNDRFNTLEIMKSLLEIEILTKMQLFNLIIFLLKKTKARNQGIAQFLQEYGDPIINTRSMIIKNYNKPSNMRGYLPSKNSTGIDYMVQNENVSFTQYLYDNDNFKNDIINKNFYDGYDFYWNNTEPREQNDPNKCVRYFLEILNEFNKTVVSMTVIKSPDVINKQIHFYIYKSLLFECGCVLNNIKNYKNISLILHSFASSIFNANIVYSNLMESMKNIFIKNMIIINPVIMDEAIEKLSYCIRSVGDEIITNEEFKKLWLCGDLNEKIDISEQI